METLQESAEERGAVKGTNHTAQPLWMYTSYSVMPPVLCIERN